MNMRDELISKIYYKAYRVAKGGQESMDLGAIADFILEDRRRILAPLIELSMPVITNKSNALRKQDAINETLKLSGLDSE